VSAAFNVQLTPPPALDVSSVVAPSQAFSGQPLTVNWTVTNDGTGPTVATIWTDEVFMSPTSTFNASTAIPLGEFTHAGALAAANSYAQSQSVTLPVGVSGSYYFIVQADLYGQVFQNGDTAGNIGVEASASNVNLTPPPDLTVSSVFPAASSVLAGHALDVTYTVANDGSSPTVMTAGVGQPVVWTDSFYLSPTPTLDPSTEIGIGASTHTGALDAGSSYTNQVALTIPNGLTGTYYVIADADSGDVIFELDLSSKVAASTNTVSVTSEPADLIVSSFTAPAQLQDGTIATLSWTVANQGTGDTVATTWNDDVFASASSNLSSPILLGTFAHNGLLNAGHSYTTSQPVTVPISLSGTYYVFVTTNPQYIDPTTHEPTYAVYESNYANDSSPPVTVSVNQLLADLVVTNVAAPSALETGQTYTITWTTANEGTGTTNVNSWYDDVWMSTTTDVGEGGTDVYLGSYYRSNALAAGQSYNASATVTIPQTLTPGTYYIIVRDDRPSQIPTSNDPTTVRRVYESSYTNNDTASAAIPVTAGPAPDLAVTTVSAPSMAIEDQPITVSWTVDNLDAGTSASWNDAVYLSLNTTFDAASAIYLGYAAHTGGLASGQSYTQQATFNVPAGLTGSYFVLVVANRGDTIFENGRYANDIAAAAQPTSISLTPPADLVAGTITIPANAVPGEDMTFSYTVTNQGSNDAVGQWTDALYLSPTTSFVFTDPLLARNIQTGGLAAGQSYTDQVAATVPGVSPGTYYVILRTDVLDQIPDSNLANNVGASVSGVSISVPALTLGTPASLSLTEGQSAYYEVTVTAGQTLQIALNAGSGDAAASNELYVSFGETPSRSQADFTGNQPLSPGQLITMPATQAGTYFILTYADSLSTTSENLTLTASIIPFSVTAVTPAAVGNAGPSTIEIQGALFDRATTFTLVGPSGQTIPASAIDVQDAATAYVTFDLTSAATGAYSVVATSSGGTMTQLAGGLSVDQGIGSNIQVSAIGPSLVLANRPSEFSVEYGNSGDADAGAPLIFVVSTSNTQMGLTAGQFGSQNLMFLGISPDGPAGVLRPGEQSSIPIYFQAPATADAPNYFQTVTVSTDNTTPLDWSEIETWISPVWYQFPNWSAAYALLQQDIGPTWGDLVQMLDLDARLLPSSSAADPSDPVDLMNIEAEKALAAVNSSITGSLQAADLSVSIAGIQVYAEDTSTQQIYATGSLDDGSFIFPSLPAGTYSLSVDGAIVDAGATVTVGNNQSVTGAAVSLVAGASLFGQVLVQGTSQPIPNATVIASNEATGVAFTLLTDSDGRYDVTGLAAGTYDLIVSADGYARGVVDGVVVTQTAVPETVALSEESLITGVIAEFAGGPAGGVAEVIAQPRGNTDPNQVYSTSSTSGSFAIDGLPAGTYDVNLSLPGYVSQTVAGVVVAADGSADLGTISFVPTATIAGTIVSNDPNVPANDELVVAMQGQVQVASDTSDASGDFSISGLPPGTYNLEVLEASSFSVNPAVSVTAGQSISGATILVNPGGIISGTVVDSANSEPIAGISVEASGPNGATLITSTDAQGTYSFGGLATGAYEVYLLLSGSESETSVTVSAVNGPSVTANLKLGYVATLSGTLSDSNGDPVTDGVVNLYLSGQSVATASTDSDGQYTFLIVEPGTFDVIASADDAAFAPVQSLEVAAGDALVQNFAAGSGTIQVTLSDSIGAIAGTNVVISYEWDGATIPAGVAATDSSGSVTFSNLIAGSYAITALNPNDNTTGQGHVTLATSSSLGNATITLASGSQLTGTITDSSGAPISQANVALYLNSNPQTSFGVITSANGSFVFPNVPAGTYTLVVYASNYQAYEAADLSIDGPTTTQAELTPSNTAIDGSLQDPSGNPITTASVAVLDASGHVLGVSSVNAQGAFSITTASGTNLTLNVIAGGYLIPSLTPFAAANGSTSILPPVTLQPIAVDPGGGGSSFGSYPSAISTPSFFQTIQTNVTNLQNQAQEITTPIPARICESCYSAQQSAIAAQMAAKESFQLIKDQVGRILAQAVAYGATAVENSVGVLTTVTAAGFAGAALANPADLAAGAILLINGAADIAEASEGVAILATFMRNSLTAIGVAAVALNSVANDIQSMSSANSTGDIQSIKEKIARDIQNAANKGDLIQQLAIQFGTIYLGAAYPEVEAFVNFMAPYNTALGVFKGQLNVLLTTSPFQATVNQANILQQEEDNLTSEVQTYLKLKAQFEEALQAYNTCQKNAKCSSNPANPTPPPNPTPKPLPPWWWIPWLPIDPNNIIGPMGFGDAQYVSVNQTLPYEIQFENEATAGAPAQQVVIAQQLDPNLDWRTFRLGSFGFDGMVFDVPANSAFYQTTIDLSQTFGYDVDVSATIDEVTGIATWTFTTIDPATGQIPTDPALGFLPPDNSSGAGEGFVSYTILAKASDPTGTVINAQATVVFDTQPPLNTPQIFNTIDAGSGLTSTVAALPPEEPSPEFNVSWSGADSASGSAIGSFTIFVSDNGGPYTAWLPNTTLTSASYLGQFGHTYSFYSVATDNVGNVEPTPASAQATTTVVSPLTITSLTAISPNPRNTSVSAIDVTFSEPINTTSLSPGALTLTDDGGSNLINSGVSLTLVSGDTYQIGGLAGLTTIKGNYTLTVNAAGIQDPSGNPGSGTLSTSWLMDTSPPTSTVNPLPKRETSLTFAVSVTGSDGGNPPSGVASYDIYASTNGGPWVFWTNVPASNPTAAYTGQSNTTYAFYSIAHDLAGNTENKKPSIEASTYLPDLTPPVTSVDGTTGSNPSSVNSSTGTFTLDLTGSDPGGGRVTYFEVFASVDGAAYQEIGPYAIPAGAADSKGNYHSTMIYQGLTDGQSHTYSFYSIGLDSAGNLQSAPSGPNVTFANQVFAMPGQLQVVGFTVEHGSPSRSYVRYLDLEFNESDSQSGGELTSIVHSISTSSPDIQIYKYDLNGDASSKTAVSLGSPTMLDVLDHAIEINFRAGGIGGNPNTTAADGYYEVDIHLPNGQTAVHHFYRLLGDVNGDAIVDENDLNEIAASIGETSPTGWTPLSADVTGAGTVTAFDLTLATRSKGRKLGSGLSLG